MDSLAIPRLDAEKIAARDGETLESLRRGAAEAGFLTVYNTGLTQARMRLVFAAYRAFFDRPASEKSDVDMALTGANRGWGRPGSEQVDPNANPDYKQFFDCGYAVEGSDLSVYAPNLWPVAPEGFKEVIEAYYRDALKVSLVILRGLAEGIGQERDYFDDKFARPMALLRGNYYPPRPDWAGEKDFGIAAHTDYGCLTLLASDGVAGLEVATPGGDWLPVSGGYGEFIINFGEMFEIWTEGRIRATPHRVVGTGEERISVPMFFNPDFETNVAPKGKPAFSAGEYLSRRFEETYLHLRKSS